MTSPKFLAQTYRSLAQAHDTISEAARQEAAEAKAAALQGLGPGYRAALIEKLGEAASDEQRIDAVFRIYRDAQREVARLEGEAGTADAPLGETPARLEMELLEKLLTASSHIHVNETLRDHYRAVLAKLN